MCARVVKLLFAAGYRGIRRDSCQICAHRSRISAFNRCARKRSLTIRDHPEREATCEILWYDEVETVGLGNDRHEERTACLCDYLPAVIQDSKNTPSRGGRGFV